MHGYLGKRRTILKRLKSVAYLLTYGSAYGYRNIAIEYADFLKRTTSFECTFAYCVFSGGSSYIVKSVRKFESFYTHAILKRLFSYIHRYAAVVFKYYVFKI